MSKDGNLVTVQKIAEKEGISFYHVQSDKFKTVRLDIFLIDPLKKETVSQNALLPYLLRRGSRRYPSQQELALRLEELYGAGIEVSVYKKGENQLIHINAGFVSDEFTVGETKLFDEMGTLMLEVLTDPVLENGKFRQDYFEQERENLIQRIKSRVNDKMHYAMERCLEEMCTGEPFSIHEDGDEEGAKALTTDAVMQRFRELLAQSPIFVYMSGNVRNEDILRFTEKFKVLKREGNHTIQAPNVKKEVKEVRRIEEPMDVSQGKLCLGFRTQTEPAGSDYYPMVIYNGILGGGVQSKLFQNVREKESLAYTTFSRLEKFKGLLVACSGIEIENREKAEKIMMEQLKAIEEGNISDMEMEATKKSFETGMKSMQDSQGSMVDFFVSQHLSNTQETTDSFLEKLLAVQKEDVVRVSKNVRLDTVYFLTSLSGEGTERSENA